MSAVRRGSLQRVGPVPRQIVGPIRSLGIRSSLGPSPFNEMSDYHAPVTVTADFLHFHQQLIKHNNHGQCQDESEADGSGKPPPPREYERFERLCRTQGGHAESC
jgi:hypothetical protein